MKTKIKLTILAIALFSWACSNKNSVIIDGKIIGDEISRIEYAVPVNGTLNPYMSDTIKIDSVGNFHLEIPFENSGFILLRPYYKKKPVIRSVGLILAESGENYKVVFDPENEGENITIKGKYENAIKEYNGLFGENDGLYALTREQVMKFHKDSVALSIQNKIADTREKEVSVFKDLYEKGELSEELLKLVEADRFCYYNTIMSAVIGSKYSTTKRNTGTKPSPEQAEMDLYKDEMYDIWKSTFEIPESLKEFFSQSPWWYSYHSYHIMYDIDGDLKPNPEKEKNIASREFIVTNNLNNTARQYVPDELFETYFANELSYESTLFGTNSYEMISLYDQFVYDYPNSEYTPYLTPYFEKLRDYHRKSQKPGFSENVIFVDNYQELNTLAKCIEPFKGKKVYVDVWATWCAPCRAEFAKMDVLNEILQEHDIEMLYVSIDSDDNEKTWKDLLKYYEPAGYHLRANQQLIEDIRNIKYDGGVGALGVPFHLMFDENGNRMDFTKEIEEYLELASN